MDSLEFWKYELDRIDVNQTPIIRAITNSDYKKLEILLIDKTKKNVEDCTGDYNPLHFATKMRDVTAAKILLRHGFSPNAVYVHRPCGQLYFGQRMRSIAFMSRTITPLIIATMNDDEEMALILLKAGARMQISENSRSWSSILVLAIKWGQERILELLINHVDRLVEWSIDDVSLVDASVIYRQHHFLRLLLERGVDPNVRGQRGFTSLHWAVDCMNLDALNMLIAAGGNIEMTNKDGSTVLHHAVHIAALQNRLVRPEIEPVDLVKTLLLHGANTMARNTDGWTPLELAARVHRPGSWDKFLGSVSVAVIEWLLIFGAKWKGTKVDLIKDKRTKAALAIIEFNEKKRIAGFRFDDKTTSDDQEYLERLREQCTSEIEDMKMQKLFGDVTMYSFLRCSTKESLVKFVNQTEVQRTFKKTAYRCVYPRYKHFLEYNFIVGQMYQSVYNPAFNSLNAACGFILPSLVINHILNNMGKAEMENLIEAVEKE